MPIRTAICVIVAFLLVVPATLAFDAIELARGKTPEGPQQPQLAVGSDGSIHVTYGVGSSILYSRLSADGHIAMKPVVVDSSLVYAIGRRRGPRIATAGDAVCIAAIGGKEGRGRDGDVVLFRSTDQGASWSEATIVNDIPGSAREGLHALASGPDQKVCAVWLDLRSGKTEIYSATSANGGANWGKNVLVYRSPDGTVCECCHPSAAFDDQGRLYVMWRNWLGGARDMYLAQSDDGGLTFGEATKLGNGTWPLDACPMDGGAVVVGPQGTVTTVWRRENQVYLASPGQRERLIARGSQPWMAASGDGPVVAWLEERGAALFTLSPTAQYPIRLAEKAADPVVASLAHKKSPIVVAWEERHGEDFLIKCQVLR